MAVIGPLSRFLAVFRLQDEIKAAFKFPYYRLCDVSRRHGVQRMNKWNPHVHTSLWELQAGEDGRVPLVLHGNGFWELCQVHYGCLLQLPCLDHTEEKGSNDVKHETAAG